jgi:protein-histidine pros-kinase
MTPSGLSMYLARPFQIKDGACLVCHTTADMAPPAMVKLYGSNNGYGWKLNEVIGAQIVSVPMSVPIENANRAFYTFLASLAGVFVVLFVILNLMLSMLIVQPIRRMSAAADKISVGELDIPELSESGKDEVALLAKSFNRMRRSLEKAISLIDEK